MSAPEDHDHDRKRGQNYHPREYDRRRNHELSDRQMNELAERIAAITAPMAAKMAKQLVLDEIAITVGKGIISKLAYAVGLAFIAVALWLAGTGHIKP